MTVVLRSAIVADAEALAFVRHTTWRQTYRHLVPVEFWATFTIEANRQRWRDWLERGADVTLAEVDGGVVGFAMAGQALTTGPHPPVRRRQLYSLYVLASHHGLGVGRSLLDTVLPPGTPAQLWVAEENPRAHRFYARNGFVPDGAAFTDDESGIAEIRLVRGSRDPGATRVHDAPAS